MKVRFRDYIDLAFKRLVKEPATKGLVLARYKLELGGKDGFRVNGIAGYWGRYASADKIVELARTLHGSGDWFTFDYPAKKHDGKYSHTIGLHASESSESIEVQFLESSAQCGAYHKIVAIDSLADEIHRLGEIEDNFDAFGYKYRDFQDDS